MLVNSETRITPNFFLNDVLWVAPNLVGKYIVRHFPNGQINRYKITETEAYRGEEDLACHARKGKTTRTEVMYWEGGFIYVYLIYGMHYMLNVVTSTANNPQAVLIRCTENAQGPGRVTKLLQIDNGYNKKYITNLPDLWFEDNPDKSKIKTAPRVGIDYAGELWKNKPWRFIAD